MNELAWHRFNRVDQPASDSGISPQQGSKLQITGFNTGRIYQFCYAELVACGGFEPPPPWLRAGATFQ